jgi:uncharacterized membrane protein
MQKDRLTAFSDGVIAVIITIMVLGLKTPAAASLASLRDSLPGFAAYVLSFTYVAIYWNNHHHFFHLVKHVDGAVLWANMHLLFWLSLVPFATSWLNEHPTDAWPTALYGISLLMTALAWYVMQCVLIRAQGTDAPLTRALGRDFKGKISPALYLAGIALSFIEVWMADAIYTIVALLWLIPDRRMETAVNQTE